MNFIRHLHIAAIVLGCLMANTIAHAQSDENILDQEVSISFEGLSTEESLAKLEKKVGIYTAYNKKELKNQKVSLTFDKELLSEILDVILASENLDYKLIGNTITIYRSAKANIKPLPIEPKIAKHTINGYIVDSSSKETLIGANIRINDLDIGATTNEFGFYSITIPDGDHEISFSYIGYETTVQQLALDKDVVVSPSLQPGNELSEVVITDDAMKQRHSETKMSTNALPVDKIKSMPMLMGERDMIRLAQLMPGVQSGSEGSNGLYVRGGGPDQNLILIDGVPIYNISHLAGFISTLNGDAIKTAEVIKGGFPASYGGRLSSIIDIRMKDGNMEEIHGDFSMGLISGKFNLEGPLIKDKTSFNISARRTWLDVLSTPIQKLEALGRKNKTFFNYFFYDLNAKVNHKFSNKSRLYLSSYLGDDDVKFRKDNTDDKEHGDLLSGNRIFSLRWNYQLSPKVFSNATVYRSAYRKSFVNNIIPYSQEGVRRDFSSRSNVIDHGAKWDIDFLPDPDHQIKFGIGFIDHDFSPTANENIKKVGSQDPEITGAPPFKINATELSAYIEDHVAIGDRFKVNVGIHISDFIVQNSNYFSLQPRLAASYTLTENSSVKFSYTQMRQMIHLLTSPGLGFPNDLWVTSTDKIKPEASTQYAAGYTHSLGKGFELTVEAYYKSMKNLLEYRSGYSFFSTGENWERAVLLGNGKSYGAEFLLEKKIGKTTGWIGYTLAKSDRTFPEINEGKVFPYKYDRRHDISIAMTHKKSERLDFGLVWVYGSGNTYTLGTQNYNAIGVLESNPNTNTFLSTFEPINYVSTRNNQRAPAFHRLDLSVNFHKIKKRGNRTWTLGIYNAYARRNPFSITVEQREETGETAIYQQSLFGIIPFASYSFKF